MMIPKQMKRPLPLLLLLATFVALPVPVALAAEPPIKEILTGHFGWEADKTTKGNICTVESHHECQPGTPSGKAGGFEFPAGVAINNDPSSPQRGDVYVGDQTNQRVQVFAHGGQFVLMFGKEVNQTTKGDVCTAASGNVCQAGVEGAGSGQFAVPESAVVDPHTGNVFVEDYVNSRVQEFTATGEFVLTFGKEVNKTTKGNVCTAASGNTCGAGQRAATGSTEPGAFNFDQGAGGLLAMGGPEDLLYVGDEHRVQEFKVDGTPAGEISLASISSAPNSNVTALAVDQAGNVYLVYNYVESTTSNIIREFDPTAVEVRHFELTPIRPKGIGIAVEIHTVALDPGGRLAVSEQERYFAEGVQTTTNRGELYEVGTTNLHLLTEFDVGRSIGMAFDAEDDLYAVTEDEVNFYHPVAVTELLPGPAGCAAGADHETDATFTCSLTGTANPENVAQTEVAFQWGPSQSLGSETLKQQVATGGTPEPVSAELAGLHPNATVFYRLAGFDANNPPSETALNSETLSLQTPVVAPRIAGEASASFVHSSSAVLFGELNPENAPTKYGFQLCASESVATCTTPLENASLESSSYGKLATTIEVTGLQPATEYRYRLVATNEHEVAGQLVGGHATGPEAAFITPVVAVPRATTGSSSAIGTTSAIISGIVNPEGQPATYAFELGQDAGPETQYGLLLTGPTGSGHTPEEHSFAVSGLQPGTTYAYRIRSGNVIGAAVTFTTLGLPSALISPTPLALLAVPSIAFPAAVASQPATKAVKCPKPKRLTHGKCARPKPKKKNAKAKSRTQKAKR